MHSLQAHAAGRAAAQRRTFGAEAPCVSTGDAGMAQGVCCAGELLLDACVFGTQPLDLASQTIPAVVLRLQECNQPRIVMLQITRMCANACWRMLVSTHCRRS